jgi:hypothetical protein
MAQTYFYGFEIYNCRYRNFREDDCKSLINFSKENNLLMFDVIGLVRLGTHV